MVQAAETSTTWDAGPAVTLKPPLAFEVSPGLDAVSTHADPECANTRFENTAWPDAFVMALVVAPASKVQAPDVRATETATPACATLTFELSRNWTTGAVIVEPAATPVTFVENASCAGAPAAPATPASET